MIDEDDVVLRIDQEILGIPILVQNQVVEYLHARELMAPRDGRRNDEHVGAQAQARREAGEDRHECGGGGRVARELSQEDLPAWFERLSDTEAAGLAGDPVENSMQNVAALLRDRPILNYWVRRGIGAVPEPGFAHEGPKVCLKRILGENIFGVNPCASDMVFRVAVEKIVAQFTYFRIIVIEHMNAVIKDKVIGFFGVCQSANAVGFLKNHAVSTKMVRCA